jgi:LysW-gamma-L-lysine carboxypeptidase
VEEVTFLEALLSIPSPSGEEDAIAQYLIKQMSARGFQVDRDEAGNVIATVGDPDAEHKIVLLGHMDTVPGLVPVRLDGDRLYGRGAVDAKGPLAAFVLAAARVAPLLTGAQLVVIGAVEEEAHSRGAHHLARSMPPPSTTIIGEPSGWQGITLGYKGTMSVDYRLVRSNRHVASGWSTPAEDAVGFWNRLTAYAASLNQGREQRFDTLDPALRTIHTSDSGLEGGVEMTIGLRLPPGGDVRALQRQMRSWSGEAELAFPYSEAPFRAEKNTPLVRSLLRAIRAVGGRPRFKLKTGTSDMNVVGPAWDCPIVAYGPGDSALDHTPNEHIEIGEFLRGVSVLVKALGDLTS